MPEDVNGPASVGGPINGATGPDGIRCVAATGFHVETPGSREDATGESKQIQ